MDKLIEVLEAADATIIANFKDQLNWDISTATGVGLADFVSSLDAALTLVGTNWDYGLYRVNGQYTSEVGETGTFSNVEATGATPAIALVLAALRARLAMEAGRG